ncbi:MAG: hypothetical protein WC851_04630 [Candidatus Shapirobacteria bacterium]|jgi:hypothetical protein
MSKENKQVLFAMIVMVALIAGFAGFVNYKLNQVVKALAAIPTPAPVEINVNVEPFIMPEAGTEGSWIAPGGFGLAPFSGGSLPEGSFESISFYLGTTEDGSKSHEWVSVRADEATVGGAGASFKNIYAYDETQKRVAFVVFKVDGSQWVFIFDQDGKVTESFEVSVQEYGTIEKMAGLMFEYGTTGAKVTMVTEKGHMYRHFPTDGSPSPAIDLIFP